MLHRLIRPTAIAALAAAAAVALAGPASAATSPEIPSAPRTAKLQAKKHTKPSPKLRQRMLRKLGRIERAAQRGSSRMARDMLISQPTGAIAVFTGCTPILNVWSVCRWEYQSYGYVVGTESYWWYWSSSIGDWVHFATTTT
jgi:hypothetical protein